MYCLTVKCTEQFLQVLLIIWGKWDKIFKILSMKIEKSSTLIEDVNFSFWLLCRTVWHFKKNNAYNWISPPVPPSARGIMTPIIEMPFIKRQHLIMTRQQAYFSTDEQNSRKHKNCKNGIVHLCYLKLWQILPYFFLLNTYKVF